MNINIINTIINEIETKGVKEISIADDNFIHINYLDCSSRFLYTNDKKFLKELKIIQKIINEVYEN